MGVRLTSSLSLQGREGGKVFFLSLSLEIQGFVLFPIPRGEKKTEV